MRTILLATLLALATPVPLAAAHHDQWACESTAYNLNRIHVEVFRGPCLGVIVNTRGVLGCVFDHHEHEDLPTHRVHFVLHNSHTYPTSGVPGRECQTGIVLERPYSGDEAPLLP